MTQPNVRLESIAFDGPFELLFALIEKKEYDIYDIPISELADQYIEYINSINFYYLDSMDNMSEFVLMAATLLEIKSRMLIPRPIVEKHDDETDPRDELVKRLVEYKRFKDVTEVLREKEEEASRRFFRLTDPDLRSLVKYIESNSRSNSGDILNGVTLESLYKVFEDVVNRREAAPGNEIRITPIDSENFTIEGKIDYINSLLLQNKQISFAKIFEGCVSKVEKVVTFLAALELMRMLKVKARQDNVFGDIYLSLN